MPATVPPSDLDVFTSQLAERLPQWLQHYQVPGAAVALVQNGEVVWAQGYGLAEEARGVPVTPETIFQAASISKSVTAWGVLRLAEKGQIDLDAPVEQYLARWRLPASDHDAQGVTIRRLLSHSAGLSLHGYPGWPPEQSLPSLEESLSGHRGEAVRLAQEAGTRFSYSGGGYTLLQLLIEEVTGRAFSTYMQQEVLDPLGLAHSSFEWRPDLRPATARGYDSQGQPLPNYLFIEQAAAGLYTSAPDLARFVAASMTGPNGEPAGRGVVTPKMLDQMFTPVVQLQDLETFIGDAMGLGYFIETLPDGTTAVGHSGGNRGWRLHFLALPERRAGIVVLTNSDRGTELCAEVLSAWGHWLGTGAPEISRTFLTLRMSVQIVASLLGLGLVLRIGVLVHQYRTRRRQWRWRRSTPLKFKGYLGLALLMLIATSVAWSWWTFAHPFLTGLVPNPANWLTLVILCWCAVAAMAALLPSAEAS